MPISARPLAVWCAAALLTAGCSQMVGGNAVRALPGIDDDSRRRSMSRPLMLDQSQMRAITGAGDDLTIIPSMDGKIPVDIDQLAKTAPPQCQWVFEETQTFGPDVEEFHKTTFQNPPRGGLISEGAAAYRDPATARRAFDGLVALVDGCGSTALGPMFVGEWTRDAGLGADASRQRLRARLPGEERRAGGGHFVCVSRFGARHRDDEHPGQGARVIAEIEFPVVKPRV